MFEYFEGKLVEKTPTYAVIDCGGVGYLLHISLNTYSKLENKVACKLFAHQAIREDAHVLYGFAETHERDVFRNLISVSGVGASTARMILSSLSPAEIEQGIVNGNVALFKSVKGIGEKSAQRIIVDLRGKVGKDQLAGVFVAGGVVNKEREEALAALMMLGFAKNMAEKAIEKATKAEGGSLSVEQLIKASLKQL